MLVGLEGAIEELLDVDPDALSDAALHELVVEAERAESRFALARARLLAAWEARRLWMGDGSKQASVRLSRECDLSPSTARREMNRARKQREMSVAAAAVAEGKLSVDQFDLLGHACQPAVAARFGADESFLVDGVRDLRFSHATRFVQYWLNEAHEEVGIEPGSQQWQGRELFASVTFEKTVEIKGRFDTIGGAIFRNELKRLEQELFEADWAEAREKYGANAHSDDLSRTAAQRRADAAVEMARRSANMSPNAVRARPLITVLTGYDGFAKTCELSDGTVITPAQVVPLLAEADIERIVFEGPSRVIEVGQKRFFGGALRRAIEVRDRHCQHPSGCDVPAEDCHIDHKIPYGEGGLTSQENGRCYCAVHNRRRVTRGTERAILDDG